jgi:hypothetical protein
MAKLVDLIQRASQPKSKPLGFASARSKPTPTMIVVAQVTDSWKAAAKDAVAAGTNVILLSGNPKDADIKAAGEAAGDSACGLIVDGTAKLDTLSKNGIDFVVLDSAAPASALQTEDLTFLLKVEEDISDIQLRTVEPLPVDALVLDTPPGVFTIRRQMELQRITGLARKPMLMSPAADINREELLSLRDSGVLLLAVDMSGSGAKEAISQLVELVEALPAHRSRNRGEKGEVTLPTPSQPAEEHDHDDEE